ncbi:MAG: Bacterial luciferase family protein [uncultured Nocardioidaceae bacterium]|uniref:Bacterial luciferase family protein n=1 Tax=uncultured Nocardioidaceae bacterium TaxID=253824 RepID=A0A6J4NWW3_9ACTN|nr:MAG: Bacterial luciferase family protein [uncultured Nocardioidaceae bacterium]
MTDQPLQLSVLDLVPVRDGQSTTQAVQASLALARVADRSGFRRYWVAEHHNMPAVAATNPPVLIAMIAGATERIRVGSGGVMLPNHAPLVVAEQFALLEAAYPGRIDLGLGRAPGSDPVTSWALRHGGGGVEADAVNRFPEHVGNVIAMMDPAGVGLALSGRTHELRATPGARSRPPVWLLGSSDYSAQLAASMGLPYVFAHHFSGSGTREALDLYRSGFRPSDEADEPTTFLTANVCVATTDGEAERLARPQLLAMVALRTGGELRPQLSVEAAAAVQLPAEHQRLYDAMRARWVIGTPDDVMRQLTELATTYAVDEVMVHPVAGSPADAAPDRAETRETTLELLAGVRDHRLVR